MRWLATDRLSSTRPPVLLCFMSVFEIIMLLCFGAAWPVSILKSWTSRTSAGKSVVFLLVIIVGYAAGIVHKILHSKDLVIVLYSLNLALVAADTVLWFRNRGLERKVSSAR